MTISHPITLSEIDEYLQDLTAIVGTSKTALSLGLRARMAVSAGAQEVAYAQLAQVGALLSEIYQTGDANEKETATKCWRSKKTGSAIRVASVADREHQPTRENKEPSRKNRPMSHSKRTSSSSYRDGS